MKRLLLIASLSALAALGANAQAAGDAAAGQARSGLCAGCHMADGNAVNPLWPKLAGQHAGYLIKQLKEFKGGDRKDPTMAPMAAPLSEQDMENLAAYFSTQKVKVGETAADKLELGRSIYKAGDAASGVSACAACHGPTGSGNPQANFPSLTGQNAAYVAKQLKAFRSGERSNDAGQMMRNVASKMSDAEIEAVAQYVQGLH